MRSKLATPVDTVQLETSTSEDSAIKKQIRGSSLLLFGKFISVGLNFAIQVLIVRYLSKPDYGAWGYVLTIVLFFQAFSTLGLKRSISRFLPIYHEKEEHDKLFGTIALMVITIIFSSVIIISAVYISPQMITSLISGDGQPTAILFILIFLVPVEAIDGLTVGLFASFTSAKAIFYRRHILSPILKLIVVLLLIGFGSDVFFLAYGYLVASIIGVIISSWILFRLLRKQGLFSDFSFSSINIPAREIFIFTIPLLTSEILEILMHSMDVLILGYFHGTTEVASYQVILPAARINKMVMRSFALLFTPLVARLFAKENYAEINSLYWQTAIWMSVLSFPIFCITFSLAKPVTSLFYGARYEGSWIFLQILSFSYFLNVMLGFNSRTLTVLGKVQYIMKINFVIAIINLVGNLLLIPRFGALGATIATGGSMILLNIFKQVGLKSAAGIRFFDKQTLPVIYIIMISSIGLFFIQFYASLPIFVLIPLAIIASILIFKFCEKKLKVEETFPEILRLPLIKYLIKTNKDRI